MQLSDEYVVLQLPRRLETVAGGRNRLVQKLEKHQLYPDECLLLQWRNVLSYLTMTELDTVGRQFKNLPLPPDAFALVAPLWCDLGCCSQRVLVLKLL